MLRSAALVALLAQHAALAAYCSGAPSPNAQQNVYPINMTDPVLVKTVKNGKLYRAGAPGFDFNVAHIYGSAYELGYAHGELFYDIAAPLITDLWTYMEGQVMEGLPNMPVWLADLISTYGLEFALDVIIDMTRPSTPQHFYDEIQGFSDAAGSDARMMLRIHMIGELQQADCSMFGAWGAATVGGKMLAMRALDWDMDMPAVQYPTVMVYHPTEGHEFANVGFVGWVGSLTGQSISRLSNHEIGVDFPDSTFGNESLAGIPFIFLLRDILQFDNSYNDTINRIVNANRTCDLILGVGDGNANTFRAFEYSASVANVFDDTNMMPLNDTWHPRMTNVVYYGMDWLCPSYQKALHDQLKSNYGALDAPTAIRDVMAIVQTGDVHTAVYDLTDQLLYVSFYATNYSIVPNPPNAYDRAYTRLNLTQLFAEPAPL